MSSVFPAVLRTYLRLPRIERVPDPFVSVFSLTRPLKPWGVPSTGMLFG